ncbi:MAG: hypothetical protein R2880_11815 [Deinococcales bacterium]
MALSTLEAVGCYVRNNSDDPDPDASCTGYDYSEAKPEFSADSSKFFHKLSVSAFEGWESRTTDIMEVWQAETGQKLSYIS